MSVPGPFSGPGILQASWANPRCDLSGREAPIKDVLFGIGLVLAFEGLLCAAFPSAMRKAMWEASQMPEQPMRLIGVASATVGVGLLWLIKAA